MPRDTYKKHHEPGGHLGGSHVAVDRIHDDLSAERWLFYFDERNLSLCADYYYVLKRPSKRHTWKIHRSYERLGRRNSTTPGRIEQPPLPEDVKIEAVKTFLSGIKVCMWDEREAKVDQTEGYMNLILSGRV